MESEDYPSPSHITDLPDSVLCSIISLLPLREAVATGILSRPWKTLWHSLTRLDINPKEITSKLKDSDNDPNKITRNRFNSINDIKKAFFQSMPIIHHVLKGQTGNIESYELFHLSTIVPFSNCLIEWIEHLKEQKKIQKLVLSNMLLPYARRNLKQFTFPDCFFRCNTLHSLKLEKYTISDAAPFEGCANLVTLRLNLVIINDKTFNKILSNYTGLENLTIKSCYGLMNLEIQTTRLKNLDFQSLNLKSFKLGAEGLVVLAIDDFSCSEGTVEIECPNIRVFQAHVTQENAYTVTTYVTHNQILDRCSGLLESPGKENYWTWQLPRYSFDSLREIYFSFDLDDIKLKILLNSIFSVSRHLHKFEITR